MGCAKTSAPERNVVLGGMLGSFEGNKPNRFLT